MLMHAYTHLSMPTNRKKMQHFSKKMTVLGMALALKTCNTYTYKHVPKRKQKQGFLKKTVIVGMALHLKTCITYTHEHDHAHMAERMES